MAKISYFEDVFEIDGKQSVLECLTDNGVPVPFSCRSGICQTCLMRAQSGAPPAEAQAGLRDSQKMQGFFLACICYPKEDLAVTLPDAASLHGTAVVRTLQPLNRDIMLIGLEADDPIEYRPGQFITLVREHGLERCYSIASLPGEQIKLHVRLFPEGRMSRWIREDLKTGHAVKIRGPNGNCFYVPGNQDQGILLVGTGTGLAPLYGILRDALRQGHRGPIRLFHGSRERTGLYLTDELRELAREYSNFEYVPCLSGPDVTSGFRAGRAHDIALGDTNDLKNWRVFVCGHPEMVKTTRKKAFLSGASLNDIYADAFTLNS